MTEEAKIEEKAKALYEASRKRVFGRPAWDQLDPNDDYDMGMRNHAIAEARIELEGIST